MARQVSLPGRSLAAVFFSGLLVLGVVVLTSRRTQTVLDELNPFGSVEDVRLPMQVGDWLHACACVRLLCHSASITQTCRTQRWPRRVWRLTDDSALAAVGPAPDVVSSALLGLWAGIRCDWSHHLPPCQRSSSELVDFNGSCGTGIASRRGKQC